MAVTVASRHKDNTLRRANNYGQYLPLLPRVRPHEEVSTAWQGMNLHCCNLTIPY